MTKAADFEVLARGAVAHVRLSPKAAAELAKVKKGTDERSVRRRRALERYFREFCENDPCRLNMQQFKKQGNYPDKLGRGDTVAIWEFKAWQWRLYGAIFTVAGIKCFVGVTVDADKKQDKADPALLAAAAGEIGKLDEYKASIRKQGGERDARTGSRRR